MDWVRFPLGALAREILFKKINLKRGVRLIDMEYLSMKRCEYCNKEHGGWYASGRFCSSTCSKMFSSNLNREETNKKISSTFRKKVAAGEYVLAPRLIVTHLTKICPMCHTPFQVRPSESKRTYCSKKCYLGDKDSKYRKKNKGGYRVGSGRSHGGY